MASRKEDEKNERIIRGLLKLPPNRRCINCNTLGPQYVCTTFSTYICTICSGIHREFTHRVKSISMAKFTPQEIASLQTGGNEPAKEIYFKEWDPQRNSAPDSSNVDRLRDFIKHVYVDRRYSGERSTDKPQQGKLGDKDEMNDIRRSDEYQSGSSRSPSYDETNGRRYSARSSPGYDARRSPVHDQDNQRHSNFGRSPVRAGVVSDWRREDKFANASKSEDLHSSDRDFKSEIRFPDNQKDSIVSIPPIVQPVRVILGENVVPLRISEPPKANSSRVSDDSTVTQGTVSSNSLASNNGSPAELKRETSLIDFDTEPEPSVLAAVTQEAISSQATAQSASTPNDDNWACFDNIPENNVSKAPPSSNSLESVLTQLSAPAPPRASVKVNSSAAVTSSNSISSLSHDLPSTLLASGVIGQQSEQHVQPPLQHVTANLQLASSFPSSSNGQGLTGNPVMQALEAIPTTAVQTTEIKPAGRKELPADLFSATYSSFPYQAPGWQVRPVPGMGFAMYNQPAMVVPSIPTYPQSNKSSNPFDVNAEASPLKAAVFPSMSSLQSALPNTGPRSVVHTPHIGAAATRTWISPQPSSYPSTMLPLASSFGSAMPGTYMGQHLPSNMTPFRPQGFGSYGNEGAAFVAIKSAASTPNASLSGNPFG